MRPILPNATSQSITLEAYDANGDAVVLAWNSVGLSVSLVKEVDGRKASTTPLTLHARSSSGQWGPAGGFENIDGTARHDVDIADASIAGTTLARYYLVATSPDVFQFVSDVLEVDTTAGKLVGITSVRDEFQAVEDAIAGDKYITVPPAVAVASQDPSVITCIRGDTLTVAFPVMGNITTRTKLVFTAKNSANDTDAQAVIQITEAAGLVRFQGSGTVTAGHGSLTVSNATTGAATLVLNATETALLAIQDLVWDCQVHTASSIASPISGVMSVVADVTRATS